MVGILSLFLFTLSNAYSFNPTLSSIELNSSLYYLVEDVDSDNIARMRNRFTPLKPSDQVHGKTWLYFQLDNPTSETQTIMLEVQNTVFFDLIELFQFQGEKLVSLGISGEQVPHYLRPVKDHYFVFPVTMAAHSTQTYFLFLNSPFSFKPSLAVHNMDWYGQKNTRNKLLYVFHFGFLFFTMALSLIIAIVFYKERIFLYYGLYLFLLLVFFLHLTGFGFEYLWPSWPVFDRQMPNFVVTFSTVFLLKFAESFLPVEKEAWAKKVFAVFFYIICFSVLLNLLTFGSLLYRKIHIVVFYGVVTMSYYVFSLFFAFRAYRNGNRPALLYFIAFLFFFIANVVYSVRSAISMHGWVGEHILQLGNIIEVIALSIGLAFWFKSHYDERQKLVVRVNQQKVDQSEEKSRIARDLHDNIGSQLTTLSIGLKNLAQAQQGVASAKLISLQEHTNATLGELRNTLWVINKSEVTTADLAEKIGQLVWRLSQYEQGIVIEFVSVDVKISRLLSPAQSLNLFRIVQEAIANSLKHSKAEKITVALACSGECIKITVEDNGIGFEWDEIGDSDTRYGLANMKRRAKEVGAKFAIQSEIGNGTTLMVEVYE